MKHLEIAIPVGNTHVYGDLVLVPQATGLVIFAHGSGSSRLSKRNQLVAEVLQKAGISTFLFDLLTPEEDQVDQFTREFRFDIPLLAGRLGLVTTWIQENSTTAHLKIGYFGASTGAGAALIAAADMPKAIAAIVSRGGRPDLAGKFLANVQCPTLLIVGGLDDEVIELNKIAYAQMHCVKELTIIPGATHLFEEPGTLEAASAAAREWFKKYL